MTDKEVMDKIKDLLEKEHSLYLKDGLSAKERKEVENNSG